MQLHQYLRTFYPDCVPYTAIKRLAHPSQLEAIAHGGYARSGLDASNS